jgi:DNA phosphorothioation-dependent restriction protein DptH
MNKGMTTLTAEDVATELELALLAGLTAHLRERGPGHCARVCDLDRGLMLRLCRSLRSQVATAQVFVLRSDADAPVEDLTVTSTKLVELRNPLADGTQRPPLLVFVPNDLRVPSEDSFGTATFEQVGVGNVYRELESTLLGGMPDSMRGAIAELLGVVRDHGWPWANDVARCRFLLTVKQNGFDAEAAGAALYELGLVPDFRLLDNPAMAPTRTSRNLSCVERITYSAQSDRGRVMELGLRDRDFRRRLGAFFADSGAEDPKFWTRRIATEPSNWPLSFDRWVFEEGEEQLDEVFVEVTSTDLPTIGDDVEDRVLQRLIGQQVLIVGKGGLRRFGVTFRVSPVPSKVNGLVSFQLQVFSEDSGPVGLTKKKKAWDTGRDSATVSFSRLNQVEWEEGWHFVRVIPLTEDGDPVPLVDENGNALPWEDEEARDRRPNESERFYVFTSTDVTVEPEQRSVPRYPSLSHALLDLRFFAVHDDRDPWQIVPASVQWSGKTSGKTHSLTEFLEARFGREGAVHVTVSRALKNLEQRLLTSPDSPLSWRLTIRNGVPEEAVGDLPEWPDHPAVPALLAARRRYLEAIRCGKKELISQAADFSSLGREIADYADAYQDLLRRLLRDAEIAEEDRRRDIVDTLRRVLAVDSVLLDVVDHTGGRRQAILIGPTHPMRALWLGVWARVGDKWLEATRENKRYVTPTRDALLRRLDMASFPLLLPAGDGSVYSPVGNLHPFWTLYAPHWEPNPRGLVSDVCAAVGLPDPGTCGSGIDGAYLAERVRRYLVQHPYVRALTLNAFNPGSAQVVVDMLLCLQREPTLRDLKYDIRVFVPDPEAPGVGEAFRQLLSPGGNITGREADAFASPSGSHLYPKLNLAFRRADDFRARPSAFTAHISMLFDVFPCEEVAVSEPVQDEAATLVHGLVQDLAVRYEESETTVLWEHQPRYGSVVPLDEQDSLSDLLASLPEAVSNAVAVAATGKTGLGIRPKTVLRLDADDRALLHQVHEVCDWVFTIDRHLGIEFFDHAGRKDRPDYLIDHSPDIASRLSHHVLVTSRSLTEVHVMAGGVLKQHGFEGSATQAAVLLDQLRSLSGRLALKLISSSTHRSEAMGLGLARLFLEYQGVFASQVVVPLDSHLELYQELETHAADLGEKMGWRRTDLALFDLDAATRTITCSLVEVKCYREVGSVGAFNHLKASVAEQLEQSEKVLRYHFDPGHSSPDRPDRLLKSAELVALLEFYLDRGVRFGLVPLNVAQEAKLLLRTIEDGYRFRVTRSAVIFDFEKPGTEPPDVENGIEFHRIGINLIRELIASAEPAVARADTLGAVAAEAPEVGPEEREEATAPRKPTTVPKLKAAAFLVPERERTTSLDKCRARHEPSILKQVPPEPANPEPVEESKAGKAGNGIAVPPAAGKVVPAVDLPSEPVAVEPQGALAGVPEAEPAGERASDEQARLNYDVVLGVSGETPQCGILGETSGRKVALDLNQTHTISLFGVQGGGKSYTLGSVVEMASLRIAGINQLQYPLATVIFHYSPTQDYAPEFTSMREENDDIKQLRILASRYGASPQSLNDIVLLTPKDKLDARRAELPGIEVRPLSFSANELQASHWRFLMGAVGSQATYIRQLNMIMRSLRGKLTMEGLRQGIDQARMSDHLKELAMMRLDLASQYIDDSADLGSLLRPGRLVIVDLRDEFIEKDEALGLFVVLLQLFADTTQEGNSFNKLVVFDEAHKYVDSPDLVAGLVEVVREMRHKGTSIMVASQDPPSVPVALIELSSQIILHRFNSPAWLKHIQKANAALAELTPERMANLGPGEAYVWSSKASDLAFSRGAVKVQCRPRVTKHGGDTRTAVNS